MEGLIRHLKPGDPDLIVEINGRYVYPRDYAAVHVEAGSVIELIDPNLGG